MIRVPVLDEVRLQLAPLDTNRLFYNGNGAFPLLGRIHLTLPQEAVSRRWGLWS